MGAPEYQGTAGYTVGGSTLGPVGGHQIPDLKEEFDGDSEKDSYLEFYSAEGTGTVKNVKRKPGALGETYQGSNNSLDAGRLSPISSDHKRFPGQLYKRSERVHHEGTNTDGLARAGRMPSSPVSSVEPVSTAETSSFPVPMNGALIDIDIIDPSLDKRMPQTDMILENVFSEIDVGNTGKWGADHGDI